MTPEAMARLHRAAFTDTRPWSADEFAALIAGPHVGLHAMDGGFAFSRTLAGETELLTLAVDPAQQRSGIGRALMHLWLAAATPMAERAFLEVAADNTAAFGLYGAMGFEEAGRRRSYYQRTNAPNVDAVIMQRALPLGQTCFSPALPPESS